MSKEQYTTMEITSEFFNNVMLVVARRIARLQQTDAAAAMNDFDQHAGSMSDEEVQIFRNAIVDFAIELAG